MRTIIALHLDYHCSLRSPLFTIWYLFYKRDLAEMARKIPHRFFRLVAYQCSSLVCFKGVVLQYEKYVFAFLLRIT